MRTEDALRRGRTLSQSLDALRRQEGCYQLERTRPLLRIAQRTTLYIHNFIKTNNLPHAQAISSLPHPSGHLFRRRLYGQGLGLVFYGSILNFRWVETNHATQLFRMGGSNIKSEKQYPDDEQFQGEDAQVRMSRTNTRPPLPPRVEEIKTAQLKPAQPQENLVSSSRHKENPQNLYRSRFNGDIPEDRLRKSKGKSVKVIKSIDKSSASGKRMQLNDDIVTVKEEKPVVNSSIKGSPVVGFETEQFQNKNFKKFSITAIIKERDLVKESNYFDESREAYGTMPEVRPVAEKNKANFNIGDFQGFETFQIKTYLFDRNLNNKIAV